MGGSYYAHQWVLFSWVILVLTSGEIHAQPVIYNDLESLITGTWTGNCMVNEVNTGAPFEGSAHYQIDYTATGYWSGFGLNMDNWGSGQAIDFTGYNALRLSYKGISGTEVLQVQLRDATGLSHVLEIGSSTEDYRTVTIPFGLFVAGLSIDLSAITELTFSTSSRQSTYSGTVYLDAIQLVEETTAVQTSLQTWARHASMGKGVNLANWLEASWLIQYGTYPEVNRYNRDVMQNLLDMGFRSVRLPVCFEIIAGETPPYSLPANHITFDLIDSTIAWAEEMGFNLIIDNHHGYALTNANYLTEINRKQAIWEQITDRYGHLDPNKYFFELYNEPTNAINNGNLHIVMNSLLATVRIGAPNHTIILGGNFWNSIGGLLNTVPYADPDVLYTFHSYDPFAFTHQGMSWTDPAYMPSVPFPNGASDSANLVNVIASAALFAEVYQVPVMLGEFGVSTAADAQSRCNYIGTIAYALDTFNMPWYYWDVISPVDAFGFLDEDDNPIPCFANALELGGSNNCALLISTRENHGPGSLREQVQCSNPGDTILIDPGLAGDTIHLKDLPLFITKHLALVNPSPTPVVLDVENSDALIFVSESVKLFLDNLVLLAGSPGAIVNRGEISIQNGEIIVSGEGKLELEGGVIDVIGGLRVK